jgi:two-component system, cell cycle response regulator
MKLLVAHDSGLYRTTLKTLLEAWGYEVVLAAAGHEAECILDSDDPPRLAILDCSMPRLSGLELCERIRARKQGYVYTILLSEHDQRSDVLKGFELGADDYLCKPFEELELRARLKVGERIIRRHEELVWAREALKFEASHDALLRLWNRRAILDLLSTELSRAKRLQTSLCIFFADLDFFKAVNDSHGHLVGDVVLRSAAERMSGAVREYDHVGRYGGEEFLAVLPNCTAEAGRVVAERVRQHIGDKPIATAPMQMEITVSIGVSQWHPGQEIRDLIHRADLALYRAKRNGRNRVEVDNSTIETLNKAHGDANSSQKGRRHIRLSGLDRLLQVKTFHQGKPTSIHGRIRNISEDGMGTVISCPLQIDEQVTLIFSMEDGHDCTVSAIVRHYQGMYCGFKFISIEPSLREDIAQICG